MVRLRFRVDARLIMSFSFTYDPGNICFCRKKPIDHIDVKLHEFSRAFHGVITHISHSRFHSRFDTTSEPEGVKHHVFSWPLHGVFMVFAA